MMFSGRVGGDGATDARLRLYPGPVRKQPGLEFILRGMRMKASFRANPVSHFLPRFGSIPEFRRDGSGINIGQRDHRVMVTQQNGHDFP